MLDSMEYTKIMYERLEAALRIAATTHPDQVIVSNLIPPHNSDAWQNWLTAARQTYDYLLAGLKPGDPVPLRSIYAGYIFFGNSMIGPWQRRCVGQGYMLETRWSKATGWDLYLVALDLPKVVV